MRVVLLAVAAAAAVALSLGAIVSGRPIFLVAAGTFALLPIAYGIGGAVVGRGALVRLARAAPVVLLVAVLAGSTLVTFGSCAQRLGPGADVAGCDFGGLDLAGRDLTGTNLAGANLAGTSLRSATLEGADLTGANLAGTSLRSATLERADLTGANLARANLGNASLRGATLTRAHLRGAHLEGANLDGADLARADLRGVLMDGASARDADLTSATLAGADLHDADMEGAVLAGADLRRLDLTRTGLGDVVLREARLDGVNLAFAALRGVDLRGASLAGANVTSGALAGANLSGAILDGAALTRAGLSEADLSDASLHGTDLTGAVLDGASLSGASLEHIQLAGATLVGATGLEDSTLASGLDVEPVALGGALTEQGIRLEPRAAILRSLGQACRGGPVSAAAGFPQGKFHPLVILDGDGRPGEFTGRAVDAGWEPMAVRFAQLVVCVHDEEQDPVEVCPYVLENGGSATITRLQNHRQLRVVDARNGSAVLDRTFQGSVPDFCPFQETFFDHHETIEGSHVGFDKLRPDIEGFVE